VLQPIPSYFSSPHQEPQMQQHNVFQTRMNRFGQILPVHQQIVAVSPYGSRQESERQRKPATKLNRFGQEITLSNFGQPVPSTLYLQSQTVPLRENHKLESETRKNRFGQTIRTSAYGTAPVLAQPIQNGRPLFVIRRNRFGQIIPTSTSASRGNSLQSTLTRSDFFQHLLLHFGIIESYQLSEF
jgi:hypothetical protein